MVAWGSTAQAQPLGDKRCWESILQCFRSSKRPRKEWHSWSESWRHLPEGLNFERVVWKGMDGIFVFFVENCVHSQRKNAWVSELKRNIQIDRHPGSSPNLESGRQARASLVRRWHLHWNQSSSKVLSSEEVTQSKVASNSFEWKYDFGFRHIGTSSKHDHWVDVFETISPWICSACKRSFVMIWSETGTDNGHMNSRQGLHTNSRAPQKTDFLNPSTVPRTLQSFCEVSSQSLRLLLGLCQETTGLASENQKATIPISYVLWYLHQPKVLFLPCLVFHLGEMPPKIRHWHASDLKPSETNWKSISE